VNIPYKNIEVNPRLVQLTAPEDLNEAELQKSVLERQKKSLASKIHLIIFEQKIDELGITVSESEVDARIEEIFKHVSPEQAEKTCKVTRAIYEALKAWHKNPSKGDYIYENMLADIPISKKQWKIWQTTCNTPEKLKSLVIPDNIENMKQNSRKSAKRDLYYWKLESIITKDVKVTKDEIRRLYEQRYEDSNSTPAFENVRETVKSELLIKKKQKVIKDWWQKQYKKANIKIHKKQFSKVKKMLN